MTIWEHIFKCGCEHRTMKKRNLASVCVMHGDPAIRRTKVQGDTITVQTLDGRGIKAQCKEASK